MISLLRAFRGADLIINHLRLTIIVYVRMVPSSEWLRKGLVNNSWEIFVFTCTQISTQCIQRHKLQPSVLLARYFIKSGPLSWNCLYNIHNKRWFSVLIASPYQLGEGVAVAPFPSQPHWWPLTGPAAVVGTKNPQLHQHCAAKLCISSFLSLLSFNVGACCLQSTYLCSPFYNW